VRVRVAACERGSVVCRRGEGAYQKNAPANAPPANISSGVTFGVKTPLHRPSKMSVPSVARLGRGWRGSGADPSYAGPVGMTGAAFFGSGSGRRETGLEG